MLHPLNKVTSLKDPLKMITTTWVISFNADSPLNGSFDTESFELRCQSYDIPKMTGDKTTVTWGGFQRNYAGKQTRQGEWAVKFTEVWDATIMESFKKWYNLYHNYKNGTISLMVNYGATVNISIVNPDVFDPQPEGLTRYDLRLYEVFPTNLSFSRIEASSSNAVEVDATFNYNYFLMGDEIEGAS